MAQSKIGSVRDLTAFSLEQCSKETKTSFSDYEWNKVNGCQVTT